MDKTRKEKKKKNRAVDSGGAEQNGVIRVAFIALHQLCRKDVHLKSIPENTQFY